MRIGQGELRPPFVVGNQADYGEAADRYQELQHVGMRNCNPVLREQAVFDQRLEAIALGAFLKEEIPNVEEGHREVLREARREWAWSVKMEFVLDLDEGEVPLGPDEVGREATYRVGTRLKHRTGSVWDVVVADLPGDGSWLDYTAALAGDYVIKCVSVPDARRLEVLLGEEIRVHRHYLHSGRWALVSLAVTEGADRR